MCDKLRAEIRKPLLGRKVLSHVEVNNAGAGDLLMIRDDWGKGNDNKSLISTRQVNGSPEKDITEGYLCLFRQL